MLGVIKDILRAFDSIKVVSSYALFIGDLTASHIHTCSRNISVAKSTISYFTRVFHDNRVYGH